MKNKKIYLIDSIEANRLILKTILNTKYDVVLSTNDNDCIIKYILESKPDLILLNVDFLNLNDGYTICEQIKNNKNISKIPLIFLSSKKESRDEKKGLSIGAVDYISTPIEPTLVLRRIQTHLELYSYSQELEKRVEEETQKRLEGEIILFNQKKLAAMGEMMDAIAHQWKQPLGSISSNTISIKNKILLNKYDLDNKEEQELFINILNDKLDKIDQYVLFLSETLDQFRKFFRPNLKFEEVCIEKEIEYVVNLLKDTICKNNISIKINSSMNTSYKLIPTEFRHVLINLINNAKDAFNENKIDDRKLIFNILKETSYIIVTLEDNAGGIPNNIINNIFDSHITTKESINGTGIGLYMTKQIVEKLHGEIYVENKNDGAMFVVKLPIIDN